MKKLLKALIFLGVALLTLGGTQVSFASLDWTSKAKEAIQNLKSISDKQGQELLSDRAANSTAALGDTALAYNWAGLQIRIPRNPRDSVSVSIDGLKSIKVGLPWADSASTAREIFEGVVAYDNGNSSDTAVVQKSDGSLQIATILLSSSAPTRYSYPFELPKGFELKGDADGTVSILDAKGEWVAGLAKPWARDSKGKEVPTRYLVQGNIVTQVVDTGMPGLAYPLVADPWLGLDLIDRTVWNDSLWSYSPTLMIYPSIFGRYFAPPAAIDAAWAETLTKTTTRGHPNPNTSAMRVQFDCHFIAVRLKSVNKPSWNLDSKLPWVDFLTEVNYGCNYPASSAEFAF